VAVAKDGRVVLGKAYGLADVDTGTRMEPFHRSRIGSVSKVITALGVMKHAEDQDPATFSWLDQDIYGIGGVLPDISYLSHQLQGRRRHTPVVGSAISPFGDHVITYYDDGTYSNGRTWDLDHNAGGATYTLPPDKQPTDIVDVAIASTGRVYVWYRDGSLSSGTTGNLDHYFYDDVSQEGIDKVDLDHGQLFSYIVGIAIAKSSDHVFVWYEDGTKSSGTSRDLDLYSQGEAYTTAAGRDPYDIRSIAISGDDEVYAFYGDNTVSSGTSWELDRYQSSYPTTLAAGVVEQPWSSWYGSMTLRHLLTHTAGFDGGGDKNGTAEMFNTDVANLSYHQIHRYTLSTRRLLSAPGTNEKYSNHGLGFAGFLLEHATGTDYMEYIEDNITGPIGLDLGVSADTPTDQDARPHYLSNGEPTRCTCAADTLGVAAGGWTASAGDLVRLMLATDRMTNHPDVLLPETLDEMESSWFTPVTYHALGWNRNSSGKLAHSGSVNSGKAYITKFPDGYIANDGTDLSNVFVAVATNTGGSGIDVKSIASDIALAAGSTWISPVFDLH
ncbi:MAG: beta-lactamase family protein, partial [Holophagales bacterium]|nr:beta-lactamase family protein [Holophagales bacterium]